MSLTAGISLAGSKRFAGTSIARKNSRIDDFELDEATVTSLQQAMQERRYSSVDVCKMYLGRISELDKNGPQINSMIELNPDALDIADKLDEERARKGPRGPLHGIPVVIKDNIDTADRMATSAGSLALAGSIATRDAFLVSRLRQAGAVILGKTNLSEWANFRSTRSSSGWSGRGGQTRNPYVLNRNPCGSSSGTGAAVAANLCVVGVGTETDGSIVCPSSSCGIVGIKPTLGLISRSGIIPIAQSQDTAGPMARTVADAALLLGLMAGPDPGDPVTTTGTRNSITDYAGYLTPDGLKGARIGVARNYAGFDARVDRLFDQTLVVMKDLGAEIVDPADIPTRGQYDDSEFEVLLYEFKDGLNRYLAGLDPSIETRTLSDLIRYNERFREVEMPYFGQEIFYQVEQKGPLTETAYREALEKNHRLSRTEGIDAVLAQYRLDALVAPTGGPAWVTDLVNGDHFSGGSSTPAAVAGYPSITLPMGDVEGLPVGLSFIGPAFSEPTLIRLAYACEQATLKRVRPAFIESLESRPCDTCSP